jgi:hypothetical protein
MREALLGMRRKGWKLEGSRSSLLKLTQGELLEAGCQLFRIRRLQAIPYSMKCR